MGRVKLNLGEDNPHQTPHSGEIAKREEHGQTSHPQGQGQASAHEQVHGNGHGHGYGHVRPGHGKGHGRRHAGQARGPHGHVHHARGRGEGQGGKGLQGADNEKMRNQLKDFYRTMDPAREKNVDPLFQMFSIAEILRAVHYRYGQMPAGWEEMRQRVEQDEREKDTEQGKEQEVEEVSDTPSGKGSKDALRMPHLNRKRNAPPTPTGPDAERAVEPEGETPPPVTPRRPDQSQAGRDTPPPVATRGTGSKGPDHVPPRTGHSTRSSHAASMPTHPPTSPKDKPPPPTRAKPPPPSAPRPRAAEERGGGKGGGGPEMSAEDFDLSLIKESPNGLELPSQGDAKYEKYVKMKKILPQGSGQ